MWFGRFQKHRLGRGIARTSRVRYGNVTRGCASRVPAGRQVLNCHEVRPAILIPADKPACHWRVSTWGFPSPEDKPVATAQAFQDGLSMIPKGEPRRLRL